MKQTNFKLPTGPERFVPNKALGQNFLTDETVISTILEAAEVGGARVVEIGPGTGALTAGLLERAGALVAVEKDARLCAYLQERFGGALRLIHGDALETDYTALFPGEPWHAVGNLPYYITTPVVLRLLPLLPESMTLMVQKEAAARFFAVPKDRVYGPVAVMTACFYTPRIVCDVPRGSFQPAPDVDSAVVRLARNGRCVNNPQSFLNFVKQAFSMRRKTLYNGLQRNECILPALESLGFSPDARAEALPPDALFTLYELLG